MPELPIVATDAGAHDHNPPESGLPKVIVPPGHIGVLPVIAPGSAVTVTRVAAAPQVVV